MDVTQILAAVLREFPAAKLRIGTDGTISGPIFAHGQFHSLRLRTAPSLEAYIALPHTDGFELTTDVRMRFFRGFQHVHHTNDAALAAEWFDDAVRHAFDAALTRHTAYADRRHAPFPPKAAALPNADAGLPPATTVVGFTDFTPTRAWKTVVQDDRVLQIPTARISNPDDIGLALRLGTAIASWPHRAVQWWRQLAAAIRASTLRVSERIALGTPLLAVAGRNGDIEVELARRRHPHSPQTGTALHLRVSAPPTPDLIMHHDALSAITKRARATCTYVANQRVVTELDWHADAELRAQSIKDAIAALTERTSAPRWQAPYR